MNLRRFAVCLAIAFPIAVLIHVVLGVGFEFFEYSGLFGGGWNDLWWNDLVRQPLSEVKYAWGSYTEKYAVRKGMHRIEDLVSFGRFVTIATLAIAGLLYFSKGARFWRFFRGKADKGANSSR